MPSPPPRKLTGRCLCGATEYSVKDAFEYALNCHCSNCRRTTGAAFKPLAGIKRAELHLTRGETTLLIHGSPAAAHDVHCGVCGSFLYSVVRDGAYAHAAMGTLVDTPNIRPSMHIFVGSKAEWYDITDTLPQYESWPDA